MNDTNHRRKGFLPSRTHRLSANDLVGIIVILLFMGLVIHTLAPSVSSPSKNSQVYPSKINSNESYSVKQACGATVKNNETVASQNEVICLIHQYAEQYGIETDMALRIAECESQYGKYEYNMAGSTAKGVYMFIDSTWEYTGGGDVLDPEQNIKRFMMYYNQHPEWWECQ